MKLYQLKTVEDKYNMLNALKEFKGNYVRMEILTDVKMKKRGNPLKDSKVQKETYGTFLFGKPFVELVKEKIKDPSEAAQFTTGKLPWGEWVPGLENKAIQYNGELYLRYYITDFELESKYLIDGKEATLEQMETINQFKDTKKGSKKQTEAGIGLHEQIKPCLVKFSNIVDIELVED